MRPSKRGLNGVAGRDIFSKPVRTITHDELVEHFPQLRPDNYQRVSLATPRYNCMAFANDDDRHWWQPGLFGKKYYWPSGVPQDGSIESWVRIFTGCGYVLTDNADTEPDCEKIAIYASLRDGSATHVAKSDGVSWKSKLGKGQDILHASLGILEGDDRDEYGIVDKLLKKPKANV